MIREYRTMDKRSWGAGPWQDECDKVQWVDAATGLDCLIVRNHMGGLCGYVGVGPEHPAHGIGYTGPPCDALSVHGGLTFAGQCDEGAPVGEGICHVPEAGRPADVWWLGFDCGHYMDFLPAMEARLRDTPGMPSLRVDPAFRRTYRDRAYVEREVAQLAAQLAALMPERERRIRSPEEV